MKTPTIDFVGRSRRWASISGALVLASILGLLFVGLELSIDFVGGTAYRLEGIDPDTTAEELREAAQSAGATDVITQLQGEADDRGALVRTEETPPGSDATVAVEAALVEASDAADVTISFVGPTWGERITRQSVEALAVFLVVVVIYISFRLEFKMAVAAVIALAHDLFITIGLYSLTDFTVSPATVIALLTILGYSLYDTVVVFDRVKENAVHLGEPGRRTYAQLVNLSMNEVLWRSLNTSITSVLPVAALLFIGSQLLGASTLQDLALALFLGMLVGIYSSLFVAAPFLSWWKMREPDQQRAAAREIERAAAGEVDDPAEAATAPTGRQAPITTEYVRGEGKRRKRRR
ncbi:MAG TPA: protein translocase subunit SecF [Egicoccus sp.]|nr:protein translocase subunit SecF [Egicoccus sp.]HSK24452.1 protein translocase subunit SecF [Egicoccus sp.]